MQMPGGISMRKVMRAIRMRDATATLAPGVLKG
jgi:hypothetical protein